MTSEKHWYTVQSDTPPERAKKMVAIMSVDDNSRRRDPELDLHQLRQPLNVIRLATANLRKRIEPALGEEDQEYLVRKLEQIEKQIQRTIEIAEAMLLPHQDQ